MGNYLQFEVTAGKIGNQSDTFGDTISPIVISQRQKSSVDAIDRV